MVRFVYINDKYSLNRLYVRDKDGLMLPVNSNDTIQKEPDDINLRAKDNWNSIPNNLQEICLAYVNADLLTPDIFQSAMGKLGAGGILTIIIDRSINPQRVDKRAETLGFEILREPPALVIACPSLTTLYYRKPEQK